MLGLVEARYCLIHSFAAMMEGWEDREGEEDGEGLVLGLGLEGCVAGGTDLSSIWRFRTSSASLSVEDKGAWVGSKAGSPATGSSCSATVWPFARRMGRLSSAWAGRGGVGARDRRLLLRMW